MRSIRIDLITGHYKKMEKDLIKELKVIIGDSFCNKARQGQLTAEESIFCNELLADSLYHKEVADLIRRKREKEIFKIYEHNLIRFQKNKKTLIKRILTKNIELVLIRPEMLCFENQIVDFVEINGYTVIKRISIVMDFNQYLCLYKEGLADPESWNDFPTRTLMYINKECIVLIIKKKDSHSEILDDADYFFKFYKGERGRKQPCTLRGDLTYNNLNAVLANKEIKEMALFILDPIMCYRHIVNGKITTDGSHIGYDSPFLFYAGAGVHIPNRSEMSKDMAVLFLKEELNEIYNSI